MIPANTQEQSKVCNYCSVIKPLIAFSKNKNCHDGHDTRCKDCRRSRARLVNGLKRASPPRPAACDCCGYVPDKEQDRIKGRKHFPLGLDHDPVTKEFRGWLCNNCNRAIGCMGDSLEGVLRVTEYLQGYRSINSSDQDSS